MTTMSSAVAGHLTPVRPTTASLMGGSHRALTLQFPPRPVPESWERCAESFEQVIDRLIPLTWSDSYKSREHRMRGVRRVLRWLETFDGQTWQERWLGSGSDALRRDWSDRVADQMSTQSGVGRRTVRNEIQCGSIFLAIADVYRPRLEWLATRWSPFLADAVAQRRDPDGFAALKEVAGELWGTPVWRKAAYQIALLVIGKGGSVREITVGDCLQLRHIEVNVLRQAPTSRTFFYTLLKELGNFPLDAPATLRAVTAYAGQSSTEELVDRYHVRCQPVRDMFVAYLNERRPALDYNTFEDLSRSLVARFWADLEHHHPGIDSLHLSPEIAAAWKERIRTKTIRRRTLDGQLAESTAPRLNPSSLMATVRAFYLDLATWAADEPTRWAQWVAPCPIKDSDVVFNKHHKRVKARADQRTRERMPTLPVVLRTAELRLRQAQERLAAFRDAPLGERFTVLGEAFTKPKRSHSGLEPTLALDVGGRRRYLVADENRAFWVWAAIEFFRHTGSRIEEMLETSHHSIVQYTLPTTGEVVPLLQIAPSKTDEERLLLVSPELADVLSTMVTRVRGADGAVPLVSAYDSGERVWNPPLPLLFQWSSAGQNRPVSAQTIRKGLGETLAASGLTDSAGNPLGYQPHDFRRIFVTDAILSGLPPHIAQVICGHKSISTTMGYKATYPTEAIEAHRAFIARRRAQRPSEEYRTPTSEEWDAFLGHFERRKLSVGICARAFGTACIHEHACVRCSLLRPDPAQRPRLIEIRDNLQARITEAEREGWLGEIEGLRVSLAGAQDKLAQMDAEVTRRGRAVSLGMPTFPQIADDSGLTLRTTQ
ncbi:tyrosine-type recombinase/integrase [Streptomyces sp. NPDC005931]|uniref:tyrosine-type recombinase/integrase n=1 Tax=Streptomyces sp. NPDC005931 TaxID=3364737 RepID=UPI0036862ACB